MEAMRWRDFDKELPAEGQRILRKIEAINESETLWAQNPYYTDMYNSAYANFDSEEYKKAREIQIFMEADRITLERLA